VIVPSPKLQFHAVGVFVLESVKVIVRGASPEVLDPQKLATDFCVATTTLM
jgi:hypothetical protein